MQQWSLDAIKEVFCLLFRIFWGMKLSCFFSNASKGSESGARFPVFRGFAVGAGVGRCMILQPQQKVVHLHVRGNYKFHWLKCDKNLFAFPHKQFSMKMLGWYRGSHFCSHPPMEEKNQAQVLYAGWEKGKKIYQIVLKRDGIGKGELPYEMKSDVITPLLNSFSRPIPSRFWIHTALHP